MNPARRTAALALAAALALPAVSRGDPRTDYMLHCQGCHGPDGSGLRGGVPSFRGQVAKFLRVDGGREYLVRVPGTSQSELDDARTAALLNWLLSTFSPDELPPDFVPYGAAEIARLRRPPLLHVEETRRNLLLAIRALDAESP